MCYAETKAELRMKEAIKTYEKETGIAIAESAFLEAQFAYLRMICPIQATLGEMKFSKMRPDTARAACARKTIRIISARAAMMFSGGIALSK